MILAAFRSALSNWTFTDYVTENDAVMAWRDRELRGISLKAVAKCMYDHLQAGGTIDQTPETRPEWNDRPFHYDFRLTVNSRRVYIEIILVDDDPPVRLHCEHAQCLSWKPPGLRRPAADHSPGFAPAAAGRKSGPRRFPTTA